MIQGGTLAMIQIIKMLLLMLLLLLLLLMMMTTTTMMAMTMMYDMDGELCGGEQQ